MKLFDKLKNALFEEEYVEVEEKPKPVKKEKPIAKKIVLPEQKREVKKEMPEKEIEEVVEPPKIDFKFPAILEDDFIDLTEKKPEPVVPPAPPKVEPPKEERPLYAGKKESKSLENKPYGKKDSDIKIREYGTYEKRTEKKEFKPSPIISPIYGILDQNYKKEDIVTKKEVRITSSYASKNIDVDTVRAKAYGIDNDSIFEEELTSSQKQAPVPEETDEVMLDISDNAPTVPKVTMGDAEEYFRDLGLEYNIDYKDASHERATGRRTNLSQDNSVKEENIADLEDNLFDLIDSMYEEKKGE